MSTTQDVEAIRRYVEADGSELFPYDALKRIEEEVPELERQRNEYKKGMRAFRDEMLRQASIERFKQQAIRKLNDEEEQLIDMVAKAQNEALGLMKELNTVKAQKAVIGKILPSAIKELKEKLDKASAALLDIGTNFDHEHHSKGQVPEGECDGPGRCRACTAMEAMKD